MQTNNNSPFKGYHPNISPFGISPRYEMASLSHMGEAYKDSTTNATAKPVDKSVANIEAEKGEVLTTFKDNGLLLHNITGERHAKGGTPLNVPEGSFIFSRDKNMNLTKNELEEYKLGGSVKGKDGNTPANVLKRNIDLKHNNRMVDLLQNSTNVAEKNTARIMLDKYQKIVGTIAALQEIKKPEGQLPPFAMLPQTDNVTEKIAKQYSKGGFVGLPKAQDGKYFSSFNKATEGVDKNLIFSPYTGKVDNFGHQKRTDTGFYGDSQMPEWTKQWYQRVSGKPWSNDTETIKDFQNTYEKYFGDKFEGEFNTGREGLSGNSTNTVGFRNINVPSTSTGQLDLNEYYNAAQAFPQSKNIYAKKYGVTPEALDDYSKQGYAKINFGTQSNIATPVVTVTPSGNTKDIAPIKAEELPINLEDPTASMAGSMDKTPMFMNAIGNLMQTPVAYHPSLVHQTGYRLREQQVDPKQGLNQILAQQYAGQKFLNQYANSPIQATQLDSTKNSELAINYLNSVNQANQANSTNVHNQNAQIMNSVVNTNAQANGQYIDKENELYQNVRDGRNSIAAANLQGLGDYYNKNNAYMMQKDLMKKSYNWDVANKMKSGSQEQRFLNSLGTLNRPELQDKLIRAAYLKMLMGNSNVENPYNAYAKNALGVMER